MIVINILFWVLIIFFITLLLVAMVSGDFESVLTFCLIAVTLLLMKGCIKYTNLDSEWRENDKCQQVEIFQQSLKNKLSEVKMNCNKSDNIHDRQRVVFDISFNNKKS